mgnify:CR=1 FL=1
MSTWNKLLARICSLPSDVRFTELKKILEKYGYKDTVSSGGSSHHIFRKKGCENITIPAHEPINKVYVNMVKEVIEREENV